MNPFKEAAAAHAAAANEVYGERLRVRPQTSGGSFTTGGDDPNRPPRDVIGTVTRRPRNLEARGAGAHSANNAAVASAAWSVGFSAVLGLDTRAGDLVVRLDEPGEPVLRLAAALPIPGRRIHPADEV